MEKNSYLGGYLGAQAGHEPSGIRSDACLNDKIEGEILSEMSSMRRRIETLHTSIASLSSLLTPVMALEYKDKSGETSKPSRSSAMGQELSDICDSIEIANNFINDIRNRVQL